MNISHEHGWKNVQQKLPNWIEEYIKRIIQDTKWSLPQDERLTHNSEINQCNLPY